MFLKFKPHRGFRCPNEKKEKKKIALVTSQIND